MQGCKLKERHLLDFIATPPKLVVVLSKVAYFDLDETLVVNKEQTGFFAFDYN